jgi:hypothetical protein
MSYLDVIKEQARTYCQDICEGSPTLSGISEDETFRVFDDANPEGGVLVNVTFLTRSDDPNRDWVRTPALEAGVEQAATHLAGKMQPYTSGRERTFKLVPQPDGAIVAAFYFLPTLTLDEFQRITLRIWRANERYEDGVLKVRFDGACLETTRIANNNPTTYTRFDGKGDLGKCLRHHGEHTFLAKQLIKLDSRLDERA